MSQNEEGLTKKKGFMWQSFNIGLRKHVSGFHFSIFRWEHYGKFLVTKDKHTQW